MACPANIVRGGGKKLKYCLVYYFFLNAGVHITAYHQSDIQSLLIIEKKKVSML
jgi:hypothetical protein